MLPRLIFGVLGAAVLLAGCKPAGKKIQQAEVSGKVLYQGKPLSGGVVKFMAANGYLGTSVIDAEGNYKLEAPVGDVQITVDNTMLKGKGPRDRGPKEVDSAKMDRPNRPALKPITGTYVPLPQRYTDPAKSGLKYTVTAGPQTHNIELSSQ